MKTLWHIQIAFILLACTGLIDWPWYVVCLPLLLPVAALAFIFGGICILWLLVDSNN
jgi:hypothetical protein